MKNGKIRRFRPRSNKHYSNRRSNGPIKNNGIQNINGQRNNFLRNNTSRNPHNLEKIIEKYQSLAKEALSVGDKILHESYLQHSDHFSRILSEVSENQKIKETNQQPKKVSILEEKK
tara:strand:- start:1579 stop:1929 length:351 start_codon:yes stop_codon:yes gene_type:complete